MPEVGSDANGEIEFSILDPEMSAILASIDPAVYAMIASRITRGLK